MSDDSNNGGIRQRLDELLRRARALSDEIEKRVQAVQDAPDAAEGEAPPGLAVDPAAALPPPPPDPDTIDPATVVPTTLPPETAAVVANEAGPTDVAPGAAPATAPATPPPGPDPETPPGENS